MNAEYATFVASCEDIPVFFQPWFWEAMCPDQWDAVVVYRGEEPAAAMPYMRHQRMIWKTLQNAPAGIYAGAWFAAAFRSERMQRKLSEAIIEQLPKHAYFTQRFHPSFKNWLPFHWQGFEQTTRYTYLIDLQQSKEQIFAGFSTDYRNNKLSKAEEVLQVSHDQPIEAFHRLMAITYKRQGLEAPLSISQFKRMQQYATQERANGKLFYALDEQERVCAALFLVWDQHTAYNWLAADDPNLRGNGAMVWLVWQAIQYAQSQGLQTYDFAGSMKQSIEQARRSFGAQQQPYMHIYKFNSPLLRMLWQLYGYR